MEPKMSTIGRNTAMAAAVALVLAGCIDTDPASDLTYEQAKDQVERYIQDAASNLNPVPRLEFRNNGNAPCSGPNDSVRNPDSVMFERSYRLQGIEPSHHFEVFQQIETYWKSKGFAITYSAGSKSVTGARKVAAENAETDFRMSLTQSIDAKRLSMAAQSPCVRRPKVR